MDGIVLVTRCLRSTVRYLTAVVDRYSENPNADVRVELELAILALEDAVILLALILESYQLQLHHVA